MKFNEQVPEMDLEPKDTPPVRHCDACGGELYEYDEAWSRNGKFICLEHLDCPETAKFLGWKKVWVL